MEERNSGGDDERPDSGDGGAVNPIIPLPLGGLAAAGGHLGAAAGSLNTPAGGAAALTAGVLPAGVAGGDADEDADMQIAERVEEALAGDGRLHATNISVAIAEGTAELSGTVASERERRTAADVCARVPGVRAVENRLTVQA